VTAFRSPHALLFLPRRKWHSAALSVLAARRLGPCLTMQSCWRHASDQRLYAPLKVPRCAILPLEHHRTSGGVTDAPGSPRLLRAQQERHSAP
jgi:hypothetical protein